MDGQISLVDLIEEKAKDPITNSTCVLINGECKNINWHDLFDGEKYDTLDKDHMYMIPCKVENGKKRRWI